MKFFKLFCLIYLIFIGKVRAQDGQDFYLYSQFNGPYGFTAIGASLNPEDNFNFNCTINTSASATLNLNPSQTVEAAYLYWSGSGDGSGSTQIQLNGNTVNSSQTIIAQSAPMFGLDLFSCFSDVTNLVQSIGNSTYTVTGIDLTNVIASTQYCVNGLDYGGWTILIIYSNPSLSAKQVNVYKGFKVFGGFSYINTINIDLNNLNVTNPNGSRFGFLAWNGTENLSNQENLQFNGNIVSNPPLNPANNPFNSTNSFNGSDTLWNMDLDYFDISNFISSGDTQASIILNSGDDQPILNFVVTEIPSELPDATVDITAISGQEICGNYELAAELTVSNTNATDILPANMPVSFFYTTANGDESFLQTIYTQTDIPIGGSENLSTTLTLPSTVPTATTILAKVNTLQDGSHPVNENNTENNTATFDITLQEGIGPPTLDDLSQCGAPDQVSFNLNNATTQIDQDTYAIAFYPTQADAENETNAITGFTDYTPASASETLFVRIDQGGCHAVASFDLTVLPEPEITAPTPLKACDDAPADGFASFQLTSKTQEITGGNTTYTVSYFATQTLAENGDPNDALPNAYTNTEMDGQTVFARVEDATNGCFALTSLDLEVNPPPAIADEVSALEKCVANGATETAFDLTAKKQEILNGLSPGLYSVSFYETQAEAEAGNNAVPDPTNFNSAGQAIFARVAENATGCFAVVPFDLGILEAPEITSNAISDIVICAGPEGATVDLTQKDAAISLDAENVQVFYYAGTANYQNGNAIGDPANFQPNENPQPIIAEVADTENGCTSATTVTFDVQIVPLPEVALSAYDGTVICTDPQTGAVLDSLDLPTLATGLPANAYAFSWTRNGESLAYSGPAYPVEEGGVYGVTVTSLDDDGANCQATSTATIIESSRPLFTVEQIGGTFEGDGLRVGNITGNGSYEFSLDGGPFQFLPPNEQNLDFTNVSPGSHSIVGRDRNGCGKARVKVSLLGFPKFFTPNGDGKNERWNISGLNGQLEAQVQVFDRFGKLLFTARPNGPGWNGNYNGRPMPANDYWFKVDYTNPQTGSPEKFTSHFTLVR